MVEVKDACNAGAVRVRSWTLVRGELLLDEANKRLESSARRLASVDQRLGILVGAAAIAGSLATTSTKSLWTTIALGLIGGAAVLGVIGSIPRRRYPELPWTDIRSEVWRKSDAAATVALADERYDLSNQRERHIRARARLLLVGSGLLVAAIVALFLSVALPSPSGEGQGRHPTPTPSASATRAV